LLKSFFQDLTSTGTRALIQNKKKWKHLSMAGTDLVEKAKSVWDDIWAFLSGLILVSLVPIVVLVGLIWQELHNKLPTGSSG
jgi:hypothetical protein